MQKNIEIRKPKIAITKPNNKGKLFYYLSALVVSIFGAKALSFEPKDNYKKKEFDGLILSGGSDLNPKLYNSNIRMQNSYDNERDKMEKYLVEKSIHENKSILGICRGAQMLNVSLGGDLNPDMRLVSDNAISNDSILKKLFNRRKLKILTNSKLWEIFKSRRARINSIHNQSLNNLGDNLKINAIEETGIVQGIEYDKDSKFILGLQWHPELMTYNKENRRIFKKFVESC